MRITPSNSAGGSENVQIQRHCCQLLAPPVPSLGIHRFHGNRHRQLRRAGKGDASALGDLLAVAPARRASANGSLFIRAALYCEVAQQERGMKRSRTSEGLATGLLRTGVHLLTVFWCGPIDIGQ